MMNFDVMALVEDVDELDAVHPDDWARYIASITGSRVDTETDTIIPAPALIDAARFLAYYLPIRNLHPDADPLYSVEASAEAIEREACRTFLCGHPTAWEVFFSPDWVPVEDGAEPAPGYLAEHWRRWRDSQS